MRNFQKIKTLDDWNTLDPPLPVLSGFDMNPPEDQQILRMLVRPKYGTLKTPNQLTWLDDAIFNLSKLDEELTGIKNSWCYVTVRSGLPFPSTDEWHFDGASLRTELIPERNYVWCSKYGFQYKMGDLGYPEDFDPQTHDMFSYAREQLKDNAILTSQVNQWYLLSPFCIHRRDPESTGHHRTFVRISFIDIEVRDLKCTQNPRHPTCSFDRDPVKSFRSKLKDYSPLGKRMEK